MSIITPDKALPGSISSSKEQIGSHEGDTTVSSDFNIKGTITGNITIDSGGSVIIEGSVIGDILNSGSLTIKNGGSLKGNLDNYGEYELHGEHNGEKMKLMAGSFTHLTGKGKIDLISEKGAHLEVSDSAEIHNSSGNVDDAIKNEGSIAISGGSVARSLTSTGQVTFTGSGVFK